MPYSKKSFSSVPIQEYPSLSFGICHTKYNSIKSYSVQLYFSRIQTGFNSISILLYLFYKIQLNQELFCSIII